MTHTKQSREFPERFTNERDRQADASRVRVIVEGARAFALGGGAVVTPSLELGLRHDGGDAETGTGVEVGGGVRYADAASGLSVEGLARRSAQAFSQFGPVWFSITVAA